EIIRELRMGVFDVLVGINLLREGLDIPEVALVAILDADKEGFLRSRRSLIQTFGRAARNVRGKVILYADAVTESMREAIEETARRRAIQMAYNQAHSITPETVEKEITRIFESIYEADDVTVNRVREPAVPYRKTEDLESHIASLEVQMKEAAAELAFERAAELRDRIRALKKRMVFEW
ncbi:MAG: UvrB/UvrC motif-containing protein, partial [Deltaproteobacteria bacterium]|nr:UvrB/UvrC motif-containing protein [Deltaproteobacteria bacterium]